MENILCLHIFTVKRVFPEKWRQRIILPKKPFSIPKIGKSAEKSPVAAGKEL